MSDDLFRGYLSTYPLSPFPPQPSLPLSSLHQYSQGKASVSVMINNPHPGNMNTLNPCICWRRLTKGLSSAAPVRAPLPCSCQVPCQVAQRPCLNTVYPPRTALCVSQLSIESFVHQRQLRPMIAVMFHPCLTCQSLA